MSLGPYPSLRIRLLAQGVSVEAVALVDSGFEGHLAVPEALIVDLPPPMYVRRVLTASGEVVRVPVWLGTVELVDQPRPQDAIIIALGDEYLIGIQTMNCFIELQEKICDFSRGAMGTEWEHTLG